MTKRTPVSVRIAPLQRVVAEPITDSAERAALDKLRKREKGRRPAPPKGKMRRHSVDARKKA